MYKCEPKKYKCRCRLLEHKIGDACVKIRKCIGKISCDVKKLIILKEYDLAVLKSLYGGM